MDLCLHHHGVALCRRRPRCGAECGVEVDCRARWGAPAAAPGLKKSSLICVAAQDKSPCREAISGDLSRPSLCPSLDIQSRCLILRSICLLSFSLILLFPSCIFSLISSITLSRYYSVAETELCSVFADGFLPPEPRRSGGDTTSSINYNARDSDLFSCRDFFFSRTSISAWFKLAFSLLEHHLWSLDLFFLPFFFQLYPLVSPFLLSFALPIPPSKRSKPALYITVWP